MIIEKNGDIFESNAEVLVNPVNCIGVMGKGLALQFKNKYPNMFVSYKKICKQNLLTVGKLQIIKEGNKRILNFPTKKHWKEKSEYEYIKIGLKKLKNNYKKLEISSIAIPMIGTGEGGLDKKEVIKIIKEILSDTDMEIELYT